MAVSTGIAWTRSTRNFWSGCTKVSTAASGGGGCDGCYAEAFQRFVRGKNVATGQAMNWGPGAPRVPHLENADRDVRSWNKACIHERQLLHQGRYKLNPKRPWAYPGFWPVFPNSHSDTFDNEVSPVWRGVLLQAIEDCEALTFQLVTKRIGNVASMVPREWMKNGFPPNVWLIITVVNQMELDRDFPKLLSLPGVRVRGLSMEPLLGEIDLRRWLEMAAGGGIRDEIWGIVGGESDQGGHRARPFVLGHAKRIVRDLQEFGYPPFVKQLGSNPVNREGERHPQKAEKGDDPSEWPEELRVQEFPRFARMV